MTTKTTKRRFRRDDPMPRQRDLAGLLRKVVDPDNPKHSRARARHVAIILCDRFDLWSEMLDRATERELARINS